MKLLAAIAINALMLTASLSAIQHEFYIRSEKRESLIFKCTNSHFSSFEPNESALNSQALRLTEACKKSIAQKNIAISKKLIPFYAFNISLLIASLLFFFFTRGVIFKFFKDFILFLRMRSSRQRLQKKLKSKIEIATLIYLTKAKE